MKNRFLTALLVACGLLLAFAHPALGQAPTFSEAISLNPSAASGESVGQATATNVAGDQYVTGSFTGTIALGSTTLVSAGSFDVFVAKRSGSTGAWLWALRAGGPGSDEGRGVAVDAGGNALVTGVFSSTISFATRPAATSLSSARGFDVFVVKFGATNGAAAWAVRAGGNGDDFSDDVAVDGGGNVLVTGTFGGTAIFATRPVATVLTTVGSFDMFVAKFAGTDGVAAWAVRAGGSINEEGQGVAVDRSGDVLVTGYFQTTASFATRPAATTLTSAGSDDVFVAKFAGTDGTAVWAVRAGGPGSDEGRDLAVDAGGNALVTGYFESTAAFATRPAATALASAGSDDVFVAKFAGTDGTAAWAVQAGGGRSDQGASVAVDAGGNALVTGSFAGTAIFATRAALIFLVSAGSLDVFVAKFGAADGAAEWAVQAGGPGFDRGTGVAVDGGGDALIAGYFTTVASFGNLAVVGGSGGFTGFVAKLQAAAPSATAIGLNKTALTLAPNPARSAATLTLPAAAQARAVTVADALGRVVRRAALPAQTTTLTLDVAGLAPGVYTVRCAAATARLVVE